MVLKANALPYERPKPEADREHHLAQAMLRKMMLPSVRQLIPDKPDPCDLPCLSNFDHRLQSIA
jgi:hypothetical protein